MNRYLLTIPAVADAARAYLRWLKEVQATLATGVRVRTSWCGHLHTQESFRRELWQAIDRRINDRAGGLPTRRKWSNEYEMWARRDQQRIRDRVLRRVRIYQFETAEARRRFGHLLSERGE